MEEGAGATRRSRRHRGKSPPAREHLPLHEDMLREILLRLPPQPSSLLRASAVSKRWRSIVTDPKFLLDPPDRIPSQRFDLARYSGVYGYGLLDCRHGCLLYKLWAQDEMFVCDPMTGQHRRLVAPPEFVKGRIDAAVLCAAGDHGHVHGRCHLSSYKVVLVSRGRSNSQPLACVYSLDSGVWGNLISTEAPCEIYDSCLPATLVGTAINGGSNGA